MTQKSGAQCNVTPEDVLLKYWGYTSFRPAQAEIIASVLAGRDTLGLLPTGGGKSVTFQVPALMLDGVTIVITPLISLMKDQVDNLRERGIRAYAIYSGLTRSQTETVFMRLLHGSAKILYVSPERLQNPRFLDELRALTLSLIVVDEAHCISQWGYDFRPSYLHIAELRRMNPDAPVLALTASATPHVVDDIISRLEFRVGDEGRDSHVFRLSFARPNISYVVRRCEYKPQLISHILQRVPGTAIVYARSRRRTQELAEELNASGISADYYHAGLDPEVKAGRQEAWKSGRTRVIVATNAFGMGIDKPDVRLVIHADLPPSLEEYYQEAGRAGRDGLPSYAVIAAGPRDNATLTRRLNEAFPDRDYIKEIYELVSVFLGVGVGDGEGHVYEFDAGLFCTRFRQQAAPVNSALRLLTAAGYITYLEDNDTPSRVMITMNKSEMYSLRLNDVNDRVLMALLRRYTGLFADFEYINERVLAERCGISEHDIYEAMLALARMHVLQYVPRRNTPYIIYNRAREERRYLRIGRDIYEERRELMAGRIDGMRRFVFDDSRCRVDTLLRYFGETPAAPCGTCDVCRARRGGTTAAAATHAAIERRREAERE